MIQNIDKIYLAIFLFVVLYFLLNIIQPAAIYDHERNCLRQFGVGYKHTTILSLWLVTILLAIFSYFTVIYIYNLNNMWF
jgi:hypothetical protein